MQSYIGSSLKTCFSENEHRWKSFKVPTGFAQIAKRIIYNFKIMSFLTFFLTEFYKTFAVFFMSKSEFWTNIHIEIQPPYMNLYYIDDVLIYQIIMPCSSSFFAHWLSKLGSHLAGNVEHFFVAFERGIESISMYSNGSSLELEVELRSILAFLFIIIGDGSRIDLVIRRLSVGGPFCFFSSSSDESEVVFFSIRFSRARRSMTTWPAIAFGFLVGLSDSLLRPDDCLSSETARLVLRSLFALFSFFSLQRDLHRDASCLTTM